uniref:Uncharacterized protein n=2 Tax=viral metagenome TaxID=1070528 RepID=A0A6M3IGJ2_9ZZZZ
MNTKVWLLIKMAYTSILRPLVIEKVEQSDSQIDDFVLNILDKIFDYDGTE